MKLKKILVPLDGSNLAAAAIETAIDLAATPFSLVLVRAAEAHTLPGVDSSAVSRRFETWSWGRFSLVTSAPKVGPEFTGQCTSEMQLSAIREAEEYLASVRADLAKRGITNVETSVWYGAPAHAIIEGARLQKADLIVMSSHGRSGLGRLILGSVAESVLRGTTVPVCIVRVPGAPLEEPEGRAIPGSGKATAHV